MNAHHTEDADAVLAAAQSIEWYAKWAFVAALIALGLFLPGRALDWGNVPCFISLGALVASIGLKAYAQLIYIRAHLLRIKKDLQKQ